MLSPRTVVIKLLFLMSDKSSVCLSVSPPYCPIPCCLLTPESPFPGDHLCVCCLGGGPWQGTKSKSPESDVFALVLKSSALWGQEAVLGSSHVYEEQKCGRTFLYTRKVFPGWEDGEKEQMR